ncbi:MAG: paeR7IR [Candidatus Solibacter sp.]|nr:paeR7IR [Candidatus Solibacter sp.]
MQALAGQSPLALRWGALELLVTDILCEAGLKQLDVRTRTALELPGYYRAEKKWDLIVVSKKQLVLAMEFKSQVGPSFGNNFNNRSEEAIGSATCLWAAVKEGRFGKTAPPPFPGYLFLLEDCAAVHRPVRNKEPYFSVDPAFKGKPIPTRNEAFSGVSYCERYELLCRRLALERIYSAASLILTTDSPRTRITEPAPDLSFRRFVAALRGHVVTFLDSTP